VVDGAGATIAGARIRISSGDEELLTSDARGHFESRAYVFGRQSVEASAEGFVSAFTTAEVGHTTGRALRLVLQRTAALAGTVRGAQGEPLDGVRLALRQDTRSLGFFAQSVDGGFVLEASPGHYTLVAELDDFRTLEQPVEVPGTGLSLTLSPGAALEVQLRDALGKAMPDVAVELRALPRGRAQTRETDAEGRLHFGGLEAGSWQLTSAPSGEHNALSVEQQVTLSEHQRASVQLQAAAGLRVEGRLQTPDGAPVGNASVRSMDTGEQAEATEQGTFVLAGLAPGPHRIRADSHDGERSALAVVNAGARGAVLTLQPRPTVRVLRSTVTAQVLGSDGRALRRFTVDGSERADPAGALESTVSPREAGVLVLAAPGYAAQQVSYPALPAGGTHALGPITLRRGRALTGLVRDAVSLAPVGDARLIVGWSTAESGAGREWRSDGQGHFQLLNVDDSARVVRVAAEGYPPVLLPLQASDTGPLEVRLERGARVRVSVLDASGQPTDASVFARGPSDANALEYGSVVTLEALAPGHWELVASNPGGDVYRPVAVELARGATAEVTLRPAEDTVELHLEVPGGWSEALGASLSSEGSGRSVRLVDGGARLLPGTWQLVLFDSATNREAKLELEVAATPSRQTIAVEPKWEALR
jgi:hypothetical protein